MKSELSLLNPASKISVVTNLSDTFTFQDNNINNNEIEIPIKKTSPLIIYAGAFGKINGVLYLVEIANEMKKINSKLFFLLAGDGHDKEKILNKSKEYGIYNTSLYCIDYIPKDQMPQLLSLATITTSLFIDIPEMVNNSANKFFDGLAAGKPIMINYAGWQKDLLQETGAGFNIPSNNAKKAAEIINSIINNKEKINQMSKASNSLANKFSIEKNYQKFKTIIDNVFIS